MTNRERAREWARRMTAPTMNDLGAFDVDFAVMAKALLEAEAALTAEKAKTAKLEQRLAALERVAEVARMLLDEKNGAVLGVHRHILGEKLAVLAALEHKKSQ